MLGAMAKRKPRAASDEIPSPAELRMERKRRKLTQTQAAALIGISLRMWQYYESTEAAKPPSKPVAILLRQFADKKKIQ